MSDHNWDSNQPGQSQDPYGNPYPQQPNPSQNPYPQNPYPPQSGQQPYVQQQGQQPGQYPYPQHPGQPPLNAYPGQPQGYPQGYYQNYPQNVPMGAPPPPPGYGGYAQYQSANPQIVKATFGQRFGAVLVDGLIVSVPLMLIIAALDIELGFWASQLLYMVTFFIYGAAQETSNYGATIGKRVAKIRVLALADGKILTISQFTARFFSRYLSTYAVGLGHLWMLWDPHEMTWHDKLSKTVVVPTDAYPVSKN